MLVVVGKTFDFRIAIRRISGLSSSRRLMIYSLELVELFPCENKLSKQLRLFILLDNCLSNGLHALNVIFMHNCSLNSLDSSLQSWGVYVNCPLTVFYPLFVVCNWFHQMFCY